MRRGDDVRTPLGDGRFWGYAARAAAVVEMDYAYLVGFSREKVCTVAARSRARTRGASCRRDVFGQAHAIPVGVVEDVAGDEVGNDGGNSAGNVGAANQVLALCVMLAVVAPYLPDELLTELIRGVGGPSVFAKSLISLEFEIEDDAERRLLLQAVRDALARVRAHVAKEARGDEGAAHPGDLAEARLHLGRTPRGQARTP